MAQNDIIMISQHIQLKDYKWDVVILYNVGIEDLNEVINTLEEICYEPHFINQAYNNIKSGAPNTGFIYTNYSTRQSLIVIGKATSSKEFIDTIVHEANHLQSHIATYYNLDEKGEEVSYLIGYVVKQMYRVFKKLIK